MHSSETFSLTIPLEFSGKRIDIVLTELIPNVSRSRIQKAIKNENAFLHGTPLKMKDKVYGGEMITIHIPLEQDSLKEVDSEKIPLDILYEDDALIVVNKQAGLVIHPAAGNPDGTLMNGLLYHHKNAALLPRAGIVHRLDKNTSGLLVVAKTRTAYDHLTKQLSDRSMGRVYHAVALGEIIAGQTIDVAIGRHHKDRKKMSVQPMGKEAITHIRVLEHFRGHTYIECALETGRTHQIRVHMSHIHHPLFGDATYGGRLRLPKKMDTARIEILRQFNRQALHAKKLTLIHPETEEKICFESELPPDFNLLLTALREDAAQYNEHD